MPGVLVWPLSQKPFRPSQHHTDRIITNGELPSFVASPEIELDSIDGALGLNRTITADVFYL
jgi:hypothetical protein